MKYFTSSFFLGLLIALSAGPVQAQEDGGDAGFSPMVLEGAISASVSFDEIEFANLPSGKIIRIGEAGVQVLDPSEVPGIGDDVPRIGGGAVNTLSQAERTALTQRLTRSLEQLMTAYDDGMVSADDTIEIVKFLLSVDLPWDERLRDEFGERFGPLIEPATDSDGDSTDEKTRITDSIEGNNDLTQDPVQVTDPIDTTTTYFAPGS